MSWETGSERIRELLGAGELGQVPPDAGLARRMLADAGRHLATAAVAGPAGDLPGAYQLAYDPAGVRRAAQERREPARRPRGQRRSRQDTGKRSPLPLVGGSGLAAQVVEDT
jgi:hypothetical protein